MTTSRGSALVTGGTGLVGSNIVYALLRRDYRVRVLARDVTAARAVLPTACEVVSGDVTDPATIAAALQGIDYLFHAAGLPEGRANQGALFARVNVDGTRHVIDAVRHSGAKRLIFTSSIVAGAEPARADACSAYSRSKYEADQCVQQAASEGLDVVILRPAVVYGTGLRSNLLLNRIIELYARIPLPINLPGAFPLVFSVDVGECHVLAMERAAPGGILNLNAGVHSLTEFIDAVDVTVGRRGWRRLMLPPLAVRASVALNEALARLPGVPLLLSRCQFQMTIPGTLDDAPASFAGLGFTPTKLQEGVTAVVRAAGRVSTTTRSV